MKTALTIAGSDPTSGAGIAADILTFNSLGVHSFFIITALTAQSLSKVFRVQVIDEENFSIQMKTVFENFKINAAKTGLISTSYQAKLIEDYIEKYKLPVIVDPVLKASDGTIFSDEDTIKDLITGLYRKAVLLTPNIIEAEKLTDYQIRKLDDMIEASYILLRKGVKAVLIKGGHLNSSKEVFDVLNTGEEVKIFRKPRREWLKLHGTGCVLSAAITAYMAHGHSITGAVMRSEEYFNKLSLYPLSLDSNLGILKPFKMLHDCVEKTEAVKELSQAVVFLEKILEAGGWDTPGEFVLAYSINKPVDLDDVVSLKLVKENAGNPLIKCLIIGLDDFTSRIMLVIKKWLPEIRACLSLPYNEIFLRELEKNDNLQYIKLYLKDFSFDELNLLEAAFKKNLCDDNSRPIDFLILFMNSTPARILVLGENSFNSIYKFSKILKKK